MKSKKDDPIATHNYTWSDFLISVHTVAAAKKRTPFLKGCNFVGGGGEI